MNNWITSGDKINGVAANNDEMAIGAILALKQAGIDPKTMCIGGIDATADGLAEVANGNLYVTVFQNAKGQGKGAVDTALALIKGEQGAVLRRRAVREGHQGQLQGLHGPLVALIRPRPGWLLRAATIACWRRGRA